MSENLEKKIVIVSIFPTHNILFSVYLKFLYSGFKCNMSAVFSFKSVWCFCIELTAQQQQQIISTSTLLLSFPPYSRGSSASRISRQNNRWTSSHHNAKWWETPKATYSNRFYLITFFNTSVLCVFNKLSISFVVQKHFCVMRTSNHDLQYYIFLSKLRKCIMLFVCSFFSSFLIIRLETSSRG